MCAPYLASVGQRGSGRERLNDAEGARSWSLTTAAAAAAVVQVPGALL